jgi:hypothetical protein
MIFNSKLAANIYFKTYRHVVAFFVMQGFDKLSQRMQ